jgi:hypothetical protein
MTFLRIAFSDGCLDMGGRTLYDLMHDWIFFSVDISMVFFFFFVYTLFCIFSMKIRRVYEEY